MIYKLGYATACVFVMMPCLLGCQNDGFREISGTVSYDGQPLQKGNISFIPSGDDGPTAAAIIADGKYSVKILPGQKRVAIEGFKVLAQRHYYPNDPKSPLIDIKEQILPARFNTQTELTREITRSAKTYDFDLK